MWQWVCSRSLSDLSYMCDDNHPNNTGKTRNKHNYNNNNNDNNNYNNNNYNNNNNKE